MTAQSLRPPSRRRFLAVTAGGVFALPGLTWAQSITANASLQITPDQDTASLAARTDAADHLTIEVTINGKGPYHFVIDTGAERSVIADDVADALDLPKGAPVTINGISKRIAVPTILVNNLAFGPFARGGLAMPVLPRASLYSDGYLGLDVINGTHVTFDFHNKALRVEQARATPTPPDGGLESARVRVRGSAGRLRVIDCLVDSVATTAFIDTGAEVSVGNVPLKNALKARNKNLIEYGTMTLTGVTGGEVTGDIIPVSKIRLQDLAFTNGTLVIADVPDFAIWKLSQRPAVLIGMDYLRQFASVTIDYRAKEIRFDLSSAPPKPSPGVAIEKMA